MTPPKILPVPKLTCFWKMDTLDTTILFSDLKKDLHPKEIQTIFSQFKEQNQDFSFLFTDGSRDDGKTGYAFCINGYSFAARLPDHFSVYSAELHAILAAINYILNKKNK